MTDYAPIDCDQHSLLEVLAMRRTRVQVDAVDERGAPLHAEGRVSDVVTRERAEYLVVDTAEGAVAVRLDYLRRLRGQAGDALWCQKPGGSD